MHNQIYFSLKEIHSLRMTFLMSMTEMFGIENSIQTSKVGETIPTEIAEPTMLRSIFSSRLFK